ncbi:MAG TPA: TonB-dependent receptor [Pyrinomonadaceae bacterium]|nr:TonB-dependent receptor [Pyrinomonadaceae bacterium]
MKLCSVRIACSLTLIFCFSLLARAQVTATGSLAGTVSEATGAVVPGAGVSVRNNATGAEHTAVTTENGTFNVPALPTGMYTVTISKTGFKKSVVTDVKVDVGSPSSINVGLEVGAPEEVVTIVGTGELLQTQTANVGTTITGRQITELPFSSRDALDLVLLLPGTNTPGRPRTSTVNGLPKGSLNITLDGINVQDNLLKSNDGFFTYIRPRIDAIDEVTLSTATPGAESSGEGAVQIRFVTRSGTNEFHGSGYWYHRNPALNANYYFNNVAGLPRDRVLLNQYGARVGGPITVPGLFSGRDRAFFFTNYEEYRLPEQVTRQRNILTPQAETGVFTYGSGASQRAVNLLTLAAANGQTSTVDPLVGRVLSGIRASTAQGSVAPFDQNRQLFTFTNTGGQVRRFATVRFDFKLSDNHHLENIWNYQTFRSSVDFLNNVDPAFPGFLAGTGSQDSNRFSNAIALRSTFTPKLVNEARFGLTGGTSLFRPTLSPASFTDLGGFIFGTSVGAGGFATAFSINNPNGVRTASRRNSPIKQFSDVLTHVVGAHTLNYGVSFTQINTWAQSLNTLVPSLTFGVDTADPANALFTTANFPGASGNDLTLARGLYSVLTGRVTSVAANAYLNEETGRYQYLGDYVERIRQREFGLFVQDSWRARPNLTLVGGLRYEVQFPFTTLNNTYAKTSYEEIFGISGPGNLFRPGVREGRVTQFTRLEPGEPAYDTDYNNFAPSVGIAYSPNWRNGILGGLFGESGRSVLRAGYSIAFVREGTNVASSIFAANPGGVITATRSIALGNLTAGTLLRNINPATIAPTLPDAPNYPLVGASSNSANAFAPDLKLGYVQSWTAGVQRELTRDVVVEARYVGTRGVKLWRQYDINETNTVESGLFNEFRLAQANLAANNAAGGARAGSFGYFGPGTGTSPLPISLAHFTGLNIFNNIPLTAANNPANLAASYSNAANSPFRSSAFLTPLFANNASPVGFANQLMGTAGRRAAAITSGLPANLFVVNPDYLGGAFIVDNGGHTYYDGLTFEVRRRMSRGLMVQGSYTFSKSLSNMYASSSVVAANYLTLRDPGLDKTVSPFNITHGFKANWIFELPFGSGRSYLSGANGVVNGLVGGWEWHGTARIQSGTPFSLGNVQLVGMTRDDLQKLVEIRQAPSGTVFFLPDDVILNTRRAFNVTATGFSTLGTPEGRYIAPAGSGGCAPAYAGQCGNANLVLHGPAFTRFDMSVIKRFKLTETANFEFRTEFLNAFNNINFRIGSPANDTTTVTNFASAAFGQTTAAYQDISTTNDTGARMIQFVLRLNF